MQTAKNADKKFFHDIALLIYIRPFAVRYASIADVEDALANRPSCTVAPAAFSLTNCIDVSKCVLFIDADCVNG